MRAKMEDYSININTCPEDSDFPSKNSYPVIGKYLLGFREIGKGRASRVYIGLNQKTKLKVAIKVVSHRNVIPGESEEDILKIMKHPNIIRLYDVVKKGNKTFIVMEYADGGELYKYVKNQGRLSEFETQKIFKQIIEGIWYCHNILMIAHRDLKAENIFLTSKNEVKIGDWEFATRCISNGLGFITRCGTLFYAAPEIMTAVASDARTVDIWSLGVLLYFMLCGKLPFHEPTPMETVTKIRRGRYTRLTSVSDRCQLMLESLLIVNPIKRLNIDEVKNNTWLTHEVSSPSINQRHHTDPTSRKTPSSTKLNSHRSSPSSIRSSSSHEKKSRKLTKLKKKLPPCIEDGPTIRSKSKMQKSSSSTSTSFYPQDICVIKLSKAELIETMESKNFRVLSYFDIRDKPTEAVKSSLDRFDVMQDPIKKVSKSAPDTGERCYYVVVCFIGKRKLLTEWERKKSGK
eukprot:TRINITY_DN5729_c0_g1_i1.p1 TRINITY_DN5729_c0_g1~~TRINITY_DN5729_c0_g1_i1.p1  ORF type:complete len:460 (-),score=58.56 TRINITY_DN5729_c0_g1_i1:130-1509(-)